MKKLLIIISILCIGIFSYAQLPSPTAHQTLNNGEQMGVFRGKLNTNGTNLVSYVGIMKDTINHNSSRILAILDSLVSHNLRLLDIERDTAAYRAEGTGGGGTTYTFSNGLTESGGSVSLGGTLSGATNINTGLTNSFNAYTAPTTPSSGVRNAFTLSGTQGFLSSYNYAGGIISTGGSLVVNPTTGFNLTGRLGSKYSVYKHNSLGPFIESDISASSDYRTVNLTPNGLIYGGDYSGSYTDRSLVDRGYVTDLFSGAGDVLTLDTLTVNQRLRVDGLSVFYGPVTLNNNLLVFRSSSRISNDTSRVLRFTNAYEEISAIRMTWRYGQSNIISDYVTFRPSTSLEIPSGTDLVKGVTWYETPSNLLLIYNGTDWDTISTSGNIFASDTAHLNALVLADSSYLFGKGFDLSNAWFTGTSTGATDTATLVNSAWIGLKMKIPNARSYFKDQKVVDGHKELKIYYVDYKTKELKSQYGWGKLGVMETLSAYSIFHERSLRYIVSLENKINILYIIVSILIIFNIINYTRKSR